MQEFVFISLSTIISHHQVGARARFKFSCSVKSLSDKHHNTTELTKAVESLASTIHPGPAQSFLVRQRKNKTKQNKKKTVQRTTHCSRAGSSQKLSAWTDTSYKVTLLIHYSNSKSRPSDGYHDGIIFVRKSLYHV